MDLGDWASIATMIVAALTLLGFTNHKFESLRAEMHAGDAALRSEMREGFATLRQEMQEGDAATRTELREEMREGFADIRSRLTVLEQRTYDLAHQPPSASA